MEIKINRANFLKGLQLTQGVVERKTTMPILSNVLLEATKKGLTFTATDLEVGVTGTYDADVLSEGRLTVHARGLYDVVKELPDETVHLKSNEKHWIEIRCGRSDFKIVGLSSEEFPNLPKRKEGAASTVDCTQLVDMIDKTAFAMSSDETRYNLNGVFLEPIEEGKGTGLRMVATDGHRLSIADRPLGKKWGFTKGVIIPRKGVMELKKLLEGVEGTFEIWTDGKHAIASRENVTIVIRLIDGQFPPYQQVVPKEVKKTLSVDRQGIFHALKRVSAMANDRTRGVRFAVSPKNLEISSSNPDFGEAHEELSVAYKGNSFEVGFNARYFIEALSVLEDEQAVFQLDDDTAPCVIRSEFDSGFTHVIMPMRL